MEKFKKYMGILEKGLNAIGIAFLVVSIVMAAFAVIGFIGIENVRIGEFDTFLELGVLKIELVDGVVPDYESGEHLLGWISLISAGQFIIGWALIKILCKMIAPMKNGDVFNESVSAIIKKLAFFVLIGGFLTELLDAVGSMIILSSYDFSSIFNTEAISGYSCYFEMNGNFFIYAAIIYLLSYVIKYGAELQNQDDETL